MPRNECRNTKLMPCHYQIWVVLLASVVRKLDSAIHWINYYPLDSAIGCHNTYPLDSDLSGGQRYPAFEQPGPDWLCHVGNFLQPITSTTQIWVVTFCSKINNGAVKCELFSQAAENPDNFHLGWKKSSVVFFPYIFVLITKDHEQVYHLTFISQSMFHQVKC